MSRRPLALALALVLLPAAAQADDLLQSYQNARSSDPQYAAAESTRAIAAERPVLARAALLPQVGGSVNYTGAPGLAARAAYRAGAGLVSVAAPAPTSRAAWPAVRAWRRGAGRGRA